jgi:hypothetical protein
MKNVWVTTNLIAIGALLPTLTADRLGPSGDEIPAWLESENNRRNVLLKEYSGFWLPGHVRSVTSSLLLGPTKLDISFSNYQLDHDPSQE